MVCVRASHRGDPHSERQHHHHVRERIPQDVVSQPAGNEELLRHEETPNQRHEPPGGNPTNATVQPDGYRQLNHERDSAEHAQLFQGDQPALKNALWMRDAILLEVLVLVQHAKPQEEQPESDQPRHVTPRYFNCSGTRRSPHKRCEEIEQREERAVRERESLTCPVAEMCAAHRRSSSRSTSRRSVANDRSTKSQWRAV